MNKVSMYLHLETDLEFIARIKVEVPVLYEHVRFLRAIDLDDHVWNSNKMQRKLLWITPNEQKTR